MTIFNQGQSHLVEQHLRTTGASRRTFLKIAGAALAAPVAGTLLAACGGDDDDEPTPDAPSASEPTPTAVAADDDEPEATATAAAEGEGQYGGHLDYAILRDPTTLDPHVTDGATSYTFQGIVYDKLVDYDLDGTLIPDLAASWEIEGDLTYRFFLREGVTFHHGGAFTADDVVYSFDRISDPETNATLATQFGLIESYEATDDYTVEVVLSEPFAPFLTVLAHWTAAIISREFSEGDVNYSTTMNGTGAFMQDAFETDVRYNFVKNENYWKPGLPYLDSIEQRAIRDDSARIAAIRAGDVDFISYAPWQVLDEFDTDPNFRVFVSHTVYNNIRLNHQSEPLNDPRVRQALSYALDRDALHDIAFGGQGRSITGGLFPESSIWHNADLLGSYTYDPDRALSLLAEAGFDDPSQIQLNFRSSSAAVHLDTAEVVAQQWRDLGIEIELETQDSPTLIERRGTGDYQVMFDGLSILWDDPDFYSVNFETGGPGHAAGVGYSNEQLDQLLREGRTSLDEEARKEIYRQVEEILLEELPMIFLFFRPQAEAMGAHVHGYATVPNLGAPPESYLESLWLEP